jgi:hypothetical protein
MDVALRYETFSYERRVPEQSLLYRILAENLETFLDRARTEEHGMPRYVEKELREYLACGGARPRIRQAQVLRLWQGRTAAGVFM